jgi:hypothetical protein
MKVICSSRNEPWCIRLCSHRIEHEFDEDECDSECHGGDAKVHQIPCCTPLEDHKGEADD